MADEDDQLLAQAKEGDRGAISGLLKRYGPEIRREIAARIPAALRAALDAHDVMQVTYLEVFLHIQRFQPGGPGSFPAWVRRLAENNLRDALRGLEAEKRPDPRKRVQPAASDDSTGGAEHLFGVTDTTPSVCVRLGEAQELLKAAIGRLPADHQTVLRMCDLEGRPVSEVAAALRRSPGAVHMLRARAYDRLRDEMPPASRVLESRF